MSPIDDPFYETLVLRTAFSDLVYHVCPSGTDPDRVPLPQVLAGLEDLGPHRFAAMIYFHRTADSMADAVEVAFAVEMALREGRRPRRVEEVLSPEGRARVDERFREKAAVDVPWWARAWARVARAIVANDETSLLLDRADQDQRAREGKQP